MDPRFTSLDSINLDIRLPPGPAPTDFAAAYFSREAVQQHVTGISRPWATSNVTWEAPALCHRPLYFEEINLERHGLSFGLVQPAVSAVHFFGGIVALPYMMTDQHPNECVYNLGYYRPGSPVRFYRHRQPVNLRAAVVEGGIVTGLILLLP